MKPVEHPYFCPNTLNEALEFRHAFDCVILAGGTDLYPATENQCLTGPTLDLGRIDELKTINIQPDGIHIGAMVTWSDVNAARETSHLHALVEAGRQVGSIQIQNSATIVGNVCNASPAADGVPPLLMLNASVVIQSKRGSRQQPIEYFITGNRQTTLARDEIVTSIFISNEAVFGQSSFVKLGSRAHLVISIAMVAVQAALHADHFARLTIAVGACNPVAVRLRELEDRLRGNHFSQAKKIIDEHDWSNALAPITDVRADAQYRRVVVPTLVRRALEKTIRERP